MKSILHVLQIVFSLILVLLILVQSKGAGINRSLSGASSFTRRGVEKIIFRSTFIIGFIFIVVSLFNLAV